ncbi:MAG: PEP-CTERM sorting domain-containing protein [Planctomycetota bacterium]|jgi:hypothetical protein
MKKVLFLLALTVVVFSFSTAGAALIGVGDVIDDKYPNVVFDNLGTISYTAVDDKFTLHADDLSILYSDSTNDWLSGPGFLSDITISLDVDSSGKLVGTGTMAEVVQEGEVNIKGKTYGAGTTILAGRVYAFGWGEAGDALGMFDFLIDNVTGALVTANPQVWPNNIPTGVAVLAENLAGWSGSWDADFDLAKVKGNKAPVPEPAMIALLGFGALALLRKRKK